MHTTNTIDGSSEIDVTMSKQEAIDILKFFENLQKYMTVEDKTLQHLITALEEGTY